VAEKKDPQVTWLPVIGKALAYLCLNQAMEKEPDRYKGVLKKVKFLQGLGLSRDEAARAAGSSPASVQVRISQSKRSRGRNGATKTKKKKRR
jgi:DNA-directed RNA polymerase specialized sigma24 family protein